MRDDDELFEFEPHRDHLGSELGKVVLVGMADFSDETVNVESFDRAGDAGTAFSGKPAPEVLVLKTADRELPTCYGFKEQLVPIVKEVEPLVGTLTVSDGFGDLVELFDAGAWVIYCRDEFEIPLVGCNEKTRESTKRVDALFHLGKLFGLCAITMFYRPVVPKEGDIIYGGLDSEDEAEFIVHLYGNTTHGVFDPGSLNSGVELISHLPFIAVVELSSKEGGDILGLDGVNGCSGEMGVDQLEILLAFEHDISCILSLHDAPVVSEIELFDDGAQSFGKQIEPCVEHIDFETIREALCLAKIRDPREDIVHESKGDVALTQTQSQPTVPVEIDLQTEGTPGGDPHIAKPQLLIDKVEVVVQTLAVIGFEESLMSGLVMPGLVALTGLHGRKDVHEPWMGASFFDDLPDAIFFPEVFLADELDLDSAFLGNLLGIVPKLVSKRFCKSRVIKDTDLVDLEIATHPFSVAETWQCPLDY